MAKLNPFSVAQKRAALIEEKKNAEAKKRPAEEGGTESKKSGKRARIAALKAAESKRAAAKTQAEAKRKGKKEAAKEASLAAREVPRCDEEFVVVEREDLPAHVELPREILDISASASAGVSAGGDDAVGADGGAAEETVPDEPVLDEGAVQEPPTEMDSPSLVESEATAIIEESSLAMPSLPLSEVAPAPAPACCSISIPGGAEDQEVEDVIILGSDTESEAEGSNIILVEEPASPVDESAPCAVEAELAPAAEEAMDCCSPVAEEEAPAIE